MGQNHLGKWRDFNGAQVCVNFFSKVLPTTGRVKQMS
jgi:hypothetical protein